MKSSPGDRAAAAAGGPQSSGGSSDNTPRSFAVPELAAVQPVHQTLLQPDAPPDLHLKHDVPLPQLVLLNQEPLPPLPIKQFVAPPVHAVQARVATPAVATAPDLGPDLSLSNLKLASSATEMARLPLPTALAAPVRTYTVHAARAAKTAYKDAAPPSISVVSLSDDPAVPNQVFALPAANQIAPGGGPGEGTIAHSSIGTGTGPNTGGADRAGTAGSNGTEARVGGGSGSGISPSSGVLSGEGAAAKTGSLAGTGKGAGDAGTGDSQLRELAGTTKLLLPQDGRFGVVVLGSSGAAPYPETAGALSGKMVYTVYVRVGQRKNWILQYCLAKSAVSAARVEGTRTPLEAPWPYTILRPEQPVDADYVLVHGNVTADGAFEKLALLFPSEFEGKDLLMRSLSQWVFRPAKRDGEPTAVEVLLIIPRETD